MTKGASTGTFVCICNLPFAGCVLSIYPIIERLLVLCCQAVDCPVSLGGALLIHERLLHRSTTNTTDRVRQVILTNPHLVTSPSSHLTLMTLTQISPNHHLVLTDSFHATDGLLTFGMYTGQRTCNKYTK